MRSFIALVVVTASGFAGCGAPEPGEAPRAPEPVATLSGSGTGAAASGDHAATPHSHAATHGGEVAQVGNLHIEGRFLKSGLLVWIRDAADAPVDLTTVSGTVVIKGPAGVTTLQLVSMGDHLHAQVALPDGVPADAVVTLNVAGTPTSVDFRTSAVGSPVVGSPAAGPLAEHDHTSLHGGVVSMWKDHHVEYVATGDSVRFYVTDARRVPIDNGVSGTVTITGVTTPLTFDPTTGALSARATPAGLVMLHAKVGNEAFSLGFGG